MKNNRKGVVLVYIMIMLGAIIVTASLAAGMSGTYSGGRMRTYESAVDVRMVAMQCGETLLMNIRNNTSLTGSGSLNIQSGTCAYSITGTLNKTITLTASLDNLYERITITTTQLSPKILATWTEVAN